LGRERPLGGAHPGVTPNDIDYICAIVLWRAGLPVSRPRRHPVGRIWIAVFGRSHCRCVFDGGSPDDDLHDHNKRSFSVSACVSIDINLPYKIVESAALKATGRHRDMSYDCRGRRSYIRIVPHAGMALLRRSQRSVSPSADRGQNLQPLRAATDRLFRKTQTTVVRTAIVATADDCGRLSKGGSL